MVLSMPTASEWRMLSRSLIDQWHNGSGEWEYRRGRTGRTGLRVFGLAAHAHTLGESALDLLDAGKTWAALPLTRFALELGVTAMWLAAFDDAIFVLDLNEAKQERALRNTTIGKQLDDTPAELKRIEALLASLSDVKGDDGWKVKTRCEDLMGGEHVYAGYKVLSNYTHASDRVADLYARPGGSPTHGNDQGWQASTRPLREETGSSATLTASLAMAGLAWHAMLENTPMPDLLRTTARQLGIPEKPTPSAQGRARLERGEKWWAHQRGDNAE